MMEVTRLLEPTLYPRRALADARQAFRDYCAIQYATLGSGAIRATIVVDEEHESDARRVVLEFLNYALDRSAQIHLENT